MFLLARDLFILIDSAIIWIYFKNSCCFPVQGHVGHYTNKFTETELDFFVENLLRAI